MAAVRRPQPMRTPTEGAIVGPHVKDPDPHPQYGFQTDIDALQALVTALQPQADTAIAAHLAAPDPHPQYLTPTEGDAVYQPLDSDLTAIAALSTQAFGRSLLTAANAAAGLSLLGAAADASVVHLAGAETVTGLKTIDFGSGALPAAPAQTMLRLSAADGAFPRILGDSWGNIGLAISGRAAGGTRSVPSATASDQIILFLGALGYNGTSYGTASRANYQQRADGLWSGTNEGVYHSWATTANGSTSPADVMWLRGPSLGIGMSPVAGAGRIQVPNHTTAAGGIALGDVGFHRYTSGGVQAVGPAATDVVIRTQRSTGEAAILAVISGQAYLGAQSNHQLALVANNIARIIVPTASGVNIPFDNPNGLTITGTSTNSVGQTWANSTASGRSWAMGSSGGGPCPVGNWFLYDNTAGAVRMQMDANGLVGIGMSPASGAGNLQVSGFARILATNGNPAQRWQNTTGTADRKTLELSLNTFSTVDLAEFSAVDDSGTPTQTQMGISLDTTAAATVGIKGLIVGDVQPNNAVAGRGVLQFPSHTTRAGGIWLGSFPIFSSAAGVLALGDATTGVSVATTVGAAGGASALPATPVGYVRININGTVRKVPYYND